MTPEGTATGSALRRSFLSLLSFLSLFLFFFLFLFPFLLSFSSVLYLHSVTIALAAGSVQHLGVGSRGWGGTETFDEAIQFVQTGFSKLGSAAASAKDKLAETIADTDVCSAPNSPLLVLFLSSKR